MLCPRRLCWILTGVIVTGSASGATPEAGARDDEIREFIAGLQHIPGDELPRAELEIEPGARVARRITQQEAIEDVERFFYLLSHGWCGYEYFRTPGETGASALDPFAQAERALLSRLREGQHWSSNALSELIHEHLAFVSDCHLSLNNEPFCRHQDFWFDAGLELHEEDGALRFMLEGESHLLLEVEGASPEPYLYPSIDAAGKAIRMLGTLSEVEPEPLSLTARREDGEVELRRSLLRSDLHRGERFAEERIGGIPVVRLGSFADYFGRELSAIVDRAHTYRGEPYVILDIRGNGGGNTVWPRRWVTGFTGASPSLKQALSELVSRTTMTGRANIFALMLSSYREQERATVEADFERYRYNAAYFDDPGAVPYWSEIEVPAVDPIPNPTTLIVIQDRQVASAGEGIVSYLYDQVENVVFVGENTKGALTFGQQSAHRLPNSKLLAYVPIKLNVPLDLEFREERGFTPDYWVPGPQALNHAVAAARAGTIPTNVPLPAGYFDVEFVPERPLPWWRVHRRDLVIGAYLLGLGLFFAIVNRKRRRVVFLIAGVVALALCAGYVFFGSAAGYVLGVVGLSYLVIGIAKRGQNR